ncbi:hypothetical protein FACS1894147_05660 [Spirochaetia bacterium]|nr:hypothetical protein FACS1894147_05660 [Spirochaetia bacterium]
MVKIDRTPLPSGVSITKAEDYLNPPVYKMLVEDFFNKCYICEIAKESKWEVDHRQSQSNFPARRYDWTNLFLSCPHCNGIKRAHYDDIIDCTNDDPEAHIIFSVININDITITAIGTASASINKTIELLNKVYNGIGRYPTDIGCANLRNKVIQEVAIFRRELLRYTNETKKGQKQVQRKKVEEQLQRRSAFAAFKRAIVRIDKSIAAEFGAAL